jgi:hypothetical protein
MSNPIYRLDVVLPISNWTETKTDIEKSILCCEEKINNIKKRAQTEEHIGSGGIHPEIDILLFCKAMFETSKLRNATFSSINTSKKNVTFSFTLDSERHYDKFYYNLVYLLSEHGILKMKDKTLKKGKH